MPRRMSAVLAVPKSETNESLPYETKTLETGRGSSIESEVHETEIIDDLFEVVWPYIQTPLMLAQESSSKALAEQFKVNKNKWIPGCNRHFS